MFRDTYYMVANPSKTPERVISNKEEQQLIVAKNRARRLAEAAENLRSTNASSQKRAELMAKADVLQGKSNQITRLVGDYENYMREKPGSLDLVRKQASMDLANKKTFSYGIVQGSPFSVPRTNRLSQSERLANKQTFSYGRIEGSPFSQPKERVSLNVALGAQDQITGKVKKVSVQNALGGLQTTYLAETRQSRDLGTTPVVMTGITFKEQNILTEFKPESMSLFGKEFSRPSSIAGLASAKSQEYRQKLSKQEGVVPFLGAALFAGGEFGAGAAKGFFSFVEHPVETISAPVLAITKPRKTLLGFQEALTTRPVGLAGELVGVSKGFSAAEGLFTTARAGYFRVGATRVPESQVWSAEVLSGAESMPLSGSVRESLQSFRATGKDGTVRGITAGPAKLEGNVAGMGKWGEFGLEDPGIYVTPVGQGSPYFLRLGPQEGGYSLSPIKAIQGLVQAPSGTIFEGGGVRLLPRNVAKKPGFEAIGTYFEAKGSTGSFFITKRSEIGLGNLPRQTFKVGQDVSLGDIQYKAGQTVTEAGTSELEAVVPYKQEFTAIPTSETGVRGFLAQLKGFDKYTTYKGKTIPLYETKLVQGESGGLREVTLTSPSLVGERAASLDYAARGSRDVSIPGTVSFSTAVSPVTEVTSPFPSMSGSMTTKTMTASMGGSPIPPRTVSIPTSYSTASLVSLPKVSSGGGSVSQGLGSSLGVSRGRSRGGSRGSSVVSGLSTLSVGSIGSKGGSGRSSRGSSGSSLLGMRGYSRPALVSGWLKSSFTGISFDRGTRQKAKKHRSTFKYSVDYGSSIEANLLDIRGLKRPSLSTSGLVIRPIVR